MSRERPSSVAEEIQQSKPFRGPGQEAVVALLRTADELRHFLSERLAHEEVTLQQYNVLRILRGAGREGLPTLSIADRMVERQPGVTRLVDRLIEKGHVARRRGTRDRRQVLCALTPSGEALLTRLDPVVDAADDALEEILSGEDLRRLIGKLDDLRHGLRQRLREP